MTYDRLLSRRLDKELNTTPGGGSPSPPPPPPTPVIPTILNLSFTPVASAPTASFTMPSNTAEIVSVAIDGVTINEWTYAPHTVSIGPLDYTIDTTDEIIVTYVQT